MDFDQILIIVGVSLGIVAVTVVVFELIIRVVCTVVRRGGASLSTLRAIREGIRILCVLVAALLVASYTGVANNLTILTLSGIAGLLISLALQPTLTNMISGYYLMRQGVIHVGDAITYGALKGTVLHIALRNTWILTDAGQVAVVGNTALFNGPLINTTQSAHFVEQFQR